MLRKRTRSHQKDQHMGHLTPEAISDPLIQSDVLGQRHRASSLFNVPGLFVGFRPKGSESDSIRSPTSPLDFRMFSTLGSPFRSSRSSSEGQQKSWDSSKVGLSIIDSLEDDPKQSGKVIRSSDSKNILFGAPMRFKTPNFRSGNNSFETTKSLPKEYAIFPYTQIKPSNLQMGHADVLFEVGETPLEPEPFGKVRSCSLDSGRTGSHLTSLTNRSINSCPGTFCSENGTNPASLPSQFIVGCQDLGNSLDSELNSVPKSIGSSHEFVGSLSASEIELSEDYTCVRTHGPNPKTTHIFGDCILECHNNDLASFSKKEESETGLLATALVECCELPVPYPCENFLSFCYSCKKKLEGEDIYMYRGEKAFCSLTCRSEEILIEEAMENTINGSSQNSLGLNNCDVLLETGMFIST